MFVVGFMVEGVNLMSCCTVLNRTFHSLVSCSWNEPIFSLNHKHISSMFSRSDGSEENRNAK